MEYYIAIVFDHEADAHAGLRRLWELDTDAAITVHGAAVVRRSKNGFIEVGTHENDSAARCAISVGVGGLLGALASPAASVVTLKRFVLARGKTAVVAETTEESTLAVEELAAQAGATIFRCAKQWIQSDQWDWDYADYLYPYEYKASFA